MGAAKRLWEQLMERACSVCGEPEAESTEDHPVCSRCRTELLGEDE